MTEGKGEKLKDALNSLELLEAEAIHIMREVVAEAENPVMLYSIGKDSSVMLHIAMKAFFPAKDHAPGIFRGPDAPEGIQDAVPDGGGGRLHHLVQVL